MAQTSVNEGRPMGSTGFFIPVLGFGTATPSPTMKEAIIHAIRVGYRHFDAAAVYNSEEVLGEAISEATRLGFIASRRDVFVTSKLWISDTHPHLVLPALQKSLVKLGMDYLDLYLIHYPMSLREGAEKYPFKHEDLVPFDMRSVWEEMEKCQKLGLTKSIGVSNFSTKRLQLLLRTASISPAVNQVEMHILWRQKKLREFCKEKGIHISAYSPLGGKGTPWGSNCVVDCELLQNIAHANNKTLAQVCLRWVYEQGVSVIVKSFNKERIEENMEIFDWKLSPEDCQKIEEIPEILLNKLAIENANDDEFDA